MAQCSTVGCWVRMVECNKVGFVLSNTECAVRIAQCSTVGCWVRIAQCNTVGC